MHTNVFVHRPCPVRRIGSGDDHHFFGYYNKPIWDPNSRYLLANRVPMFTAPLRGVEVCEVGLFDLQAGDAFRALGRTTAWNWQMGCQLQWLPGAAPLHIIYNARVHNGDHRNFYAGYQSIVCDIESKNERTLPLPVYAVAPSGNYAICVDYTRFHNTHRTIGYHPFSDATEMEDCPETDGLHRLDLESGEHELILSLADLRAFQPVASMDCAIHWVTHIEINPESNRLLFIHRWSPRVDDERFYLHRLFVCAPDGSGLTLLECTDHPLPPLDSNASEVGIYDYEKSKYQISHPMWKDDDSIIVWGPHDDEIHFHFYNVRTGTVGIVGGGKLTENGHASFSPDRNWLLTDTYPSDDTNGRLLILFDLRDEIGYQVGTFADSPLLGKDERCDLHPRWSPDGLSVCVDSVHEGTRQLYIVDVADVVLGTGGA